MSSHALQRPTAEQEHTNRKMKCSFFPSLVAEPASVFCLKSGLDLFGVIIILLLMKCICGLQLIADGFVIIEIAPSRQAFQDSLRITRPNRPSCSSPITWVTSSWRFRPVCSPSGLATRVPSSSACRWLRWAQFWFVQRRTSELTGRFCLDFSFWQRG